MSGHRPHFTEPTVRPPTRCFSMSAQRMTTGTTAMTGAAKSWPIADALLAIARACAVRP